MPGEIEQNVHVPQCKRSGGGTEDKAPEQVVENKRQRSGDADGHEPGRDTAGMAFFALSRSSR